MTGTALEVARDTVISPLDTTQVQIAMNRYQDGLKSILNESDYQHFTDKRTGEDKSFPMRSAWRKIAFWFNLDLELVSEEIERDGAGNPIRARVKARATHPNGRFAEGDGGCSIRERYFQKAEHDIPATAATRAMNRAISNLVGMGQVSAEEIEGDDGAAAPRYGPEATQRDETNLARAVEYLLGEPIPPELIERLATDAGGYLPKIVARAVQLVAAQRSLPSTEPQPEPEADPTAIEPEPEPDVEPEKEDEKEPESAPDEPEA